ncbi:MAG: FAD-dependent monooxygenase [Pseudomonadota bacterium]
MKAICAGGGVGGLAAGIALALRGHDVHVLEQAPALTEIGAGLQISPNGWRVLAALGVAELLEPVIFAPEAIEMRVGQSGARIFRLPLRETAQARWGAPYVHVHRADLVAALLARLDAVAPGALKTGHSLTGFRHVEGGVEVVLADADSLRADLLVGADGIHSAIRAQLLGPDQPRYTGNVAWRAVVPLSVLGDVAPPPTACVWVGHGRHAVTTRVRGGEMANFVGMVETPAPAPEGWRTKGSAADALHEFAGWDPTITAVIEKAEVLNRWALFDRAPLPRWSEGRVTLLGDAAHPMMPSLAQGAVQALEDAWVLAASLDAAETVEAGLQAYAARRLPRTARVQRVSAANARLFHKASTLGRWAFYGPMALAARLAPDLLHRRQDWVYGYDPTAAV